MWRHCRAFINDVLKLLGVVEQSRWEEIRQSLFRLEGTFGKLKGWKPQEPGPIRALPSLVVSELYEIFDPNSTRNPFRTKSNKWRNFLIFLILLHLGLRRSELLILTINAFRSQYDYARGAHVNWLIVNPCEDTLYDEYDNEEGEEYEADPRVIQPGLKNSFARRIVPISEEILGTKEIYEGGLRKKTQSSHLITSQKRKPLSLRQMNSVFSVATASLSADAMEALRVRGKDSVTPHDLRHTCAVRRLGGFLDRGDSRAVAEEKLRVFFGWGPESLMPLLYANAYYETDADPSRGNSPVSRP